MANLDKLQACVDTLHELLKKNIKGMYNQEFCTWVLDIDKEWKSIVDMWNEEQENETIECFYR